MPTGIYKHRTMSEETKKKISEANKIALKGVIPWNKGKRGLQKVSQETKQKMSIARKKHILKNPNSTAWKSKELHPFWKGGKKFKYAKGLSDKRKKDIRQRDKYICKNCGKYGKVIHHIDFSTTNHNLNNLVTLCYKCHTKIHNA